MPAAQEAGQYKTIRGSTLIYHLKTDSLPDALSRRRHHPGLQPMTQALYRISSSTLSIHRDIYLRIFYHLYDNFVKNEAIKLQEYDCPHAGIMI